MVRSVRGLNLSLRFAEGKKKLMIRQAREAQRRCDWGAAAKLWRQVVDFAPRETGAWIQLGNMLNELERRADAIDAFRRAAELDPTLAHAPAGIAGVHERDGRWGDAGQAWIETIKLLSQNISHGKNDDKELARAFAHAAMAVRNTVTSSQAKHILEEMMQTYTALEKHPDDLAIRATLLPPGRSDMSAAFLHDFLALLSSIDHKTLESEPGVKNGDLFQALVEIGPYLEHGKTNAEFLRVAVDLYENNRLWFETMRLAEWQAELESDEPEHLVRAFRAASAGRKIVDARRLARRHARETGDLILIHELAELYDNARLPNRARLLYRFLKRRWPHSRWHSCRYIVSTAATRSLAHADYLVQRELVAGHDDHELEQAYFRAAFSAGHYDEAHRRLAYYLTRHDDEDAEVLLGYVLANARGLNEASDHFYELASRRKQQLGAMIGTVHMAMRKRDLPLVLARWHEISIVHPTFAGADIEKARCAYDMGDVEGALRICRDHLRVSGNDLGMSEFYAWLLTMNGSYEEALPAISTILATSGPNWQAVDMHIICSSQLGTLDDDWAKISAIIPKSDSSEAISRFYHVIRILIAVGRRDLAIKTLLGPDVPIEQMSWAAPYLKNSLHQPPVLSMSDMQMKMMERRWSVTADKTRSDYSDCLDAMSDDAVDALLGHRSGNLPKVHVINKFEQPRGGSELHALDLADQIGRYTNVSLWAPEMPHPEFTARKKVSHIDPTTGTFPRGGVLVFVGIYFEIAQWISHVKPDRIIFLYNTFEAPSLFARIEEAWQRTGVRPELLYCSDIMGQETGLRGRFEPSPTDLDMFSPVTTPRPANRPFTLGRHSRDVPEKHGREDWKIYRQVADLGGESVILGGSCMTGAFPQINGMKLLKARSTGIPDFLHGLDAYFYRTSTWIEPWGRVVIEAMACGLPVLADSVGGYAQAIKHEVNGLLFDSTEEAVRLVRRLAQEPELCLRLGHEARKSVCDLLSSSELKRMIAFYLLDGSFITTQSAAN